MATLWILVAVAVTVLAVLAVVVVVRRARRAEPPTGTLPSAPPTRPPRRPEVERPTSAAERAEAALPDEGPEPTPPEERPEPATFRGRLGKARGLFSGYLGAVRSRGAIDATTWDELEEALLRADVGVATTEALLEDLRRRVLNREVGGVDDLLVALRADLITLLSEPGDPELDHHQVPEDLEGDVAAGVADHDGASADGAGLRALRFDDEPGVTNVWLFVGVNGVGKTTTVGKLAGAQAAAGRSVLLAAGDTFRAAAGEQLAQWADRAGAEIVRGAEGGDPSAIVFDAVQRAAARGNDLVLADTAGRLHTKVNLVEELKKIRRVADRPPGRVTEVLLVLDATTGQNGLVQARQFTEAVEVTGVVLTKLDGTAKGGVVVAIQRELGLPVKLVGLGEGPDDLVAFDPEAFVDALIGTDGA